MIKEIIVVEGRDDVTAVKRALDAELITTGGFGFPKGVMERIKAAQKRRGVIIFTDPDFAGEKIRKKIKSRNSRWNRNGWTEIYNSVRKPSMV